MTRRILWIIVPVVIIAGVWKLMSKAESPADRGRPGAALVAVETARSQILDLEETGTYSGTVSARSSYVVSPKISGQLSRLYADIGKVVSKGQLLAELDDRLALQELDKANAAVAMAEATKDQTANALQLATEELERQTTLLERNFISQSEFNDFHASFITERSKHNIAQASLNSAIAARNAAELQLSFTKIKADWSDSATHRVIGERFADEGNQLSSGSPIFSLMDIGNVIVRIDVIEKDYRRIKTGQIARISLDAYPNEVFQGRVARIAPMLKENTRQATVEIELPNPGSKLKPGMFSRVELSYQTKKQVHAVPATAITKRDGKSGVYIVDPDTKTVTFTEVEIGIQNPEFVEILSPEVNAEVVTLGHDLLEDGRKISTNNEAGSR
ncbi:MAG: efflux RND transporter periplasmic adaptor subunit [Candidatus Cloacimonetes bacterium]|nr:efflux RND transporter periplasmic adaptor subunit [Candidatus Cloacimonadota bacterium]